MPAAHWERAGSRSEGRTSITRKVHDAVKSRSSTPRKPRAKPDDDENYIDSTSEFEGVDPSTPSKGPLKEARLQSKNNLRQAWQSIFERYSQGQHIAAGKDDVFDFGTGEVVEDAGFLDDFVVRDGDEIFEGRSIEIGDFGLPGAMGMNELTESSCSEDENQGVKKYNGKRNSPRRSYATSEASVSEAEVREDPTSAESDSDDDMQLGNSMTRLGTRHPTVPRAGTVIRDSMPPLSRSVSAPESIDSLQLSSSDDEMGNWHDKEAPPSEQFKKLRRLREDLREDLKEFTEAEAARQRKDYEDRIKRERTCTPLFRSLSGRAHSRSRTQSVQPTLTSSAPPSRALIKPLMLKAETTVPSVSSRWHHPTPPPSFSSVPGSSSTIRHRNPSRSASTKPIGSGYSLAASKPLGRSYSLASSKPSSAPSLISTSFATSTIPLQGHYSNTLYNQAIAGDDDTSEDDIDCILVGTKKAEPETTRIPWHEKGKGRIKAESSVEPQSLQFSPPQFRSHLPSPAPSRSASPRKRSPTFFTSPNINRLPTPTSKLVPVVEIVCSSSRSPSSHRAASMSNSHASDRYPETTPRQARSQLRTYRPKQSSPLKESFNNTHRDVFVQAERSYRQGHRSLGTISISSDEDEDVNADVTSRNHANQKQHLPMGQDSRGSYRREDSHRQALPISPTKRRYSTLSDTASPAPVRTGIFTMQPSPRDPPRISNCVTPSRPFAEMQLATAKATQTSKARPRPNPTSPITPLSLDFPREAAESLSRRRSSIPWPTPPLSGEGKGPSDPASHPTPPAQEKDIFKVPSMPTKAQKHSPGNRNVTKNVLDQSDETHNATDSDDDELLLISPHRPVQMRTSRSTPSPFGKGFIRADSVVRARSISVSLPCRYRSVSRAPPRRSLEKGPTPKAPESESDDELAI